VLPIFDIIKVSSCETGKINVYDKIVIENKKGGQNMQIKD